MATVNNISKDWNAVIASAQQQLTQIAAERKQLEAAVAKYQPAVQAAQQKVAAATAAYDAALAINIVPDIGAVIDAQKAWQANPSNTALKAEYEKIQSQFQASKSVRDAALAKAEPALQAARSELSKALSLYDAETTRAIELEDKRVQLEQDIAYAKQQLAIQDTKTTPANTTTVSATTVPASNSPGNASVATTTTTTVVTSSNTVVTGTTTTTTTTTATNTNQATVDAPTDKPQSVYAFGDEIDDIYDPNLTPEQVASLSPGDQKARAAYLADNENFEGPPEEIVVTAPYAEGSAVGLSNSTFIAESTATAQDFAQFQAFDDWRVRLTLANDAQYLYRAQEPGILAPLASTDGVVFPYTPIIAVNYAANYEQTTITHSNYKIFQYSNSSVDSINITCDFTAQDTWEANYLLAVIHFFRSMTKMFYGQDEFPKNGTPPPLCYMFGLGGFQFEAHPLAITNFSYNLPNDVDYIRTTTTITSTAKYNETVIGNSRLPPEVRPGGTASPPNFDNDGQGFSPTYVPTKIQLAITCVPVMSRNAISNRFSLRDYATGNLLQGTKNLGGGIW